MLDAASPPHPDLTICDREPIEAPGHIQPHGLLIATAPGTSRISHVSANVEASVGVAAADLLGADIERLFGSAVSTVLQQSLGGEAYAAANVLNLTLPVPVNPRRKVLVHRHLERSFLELEDAPAHEESGAMISRAQSIISGLRRAESVQRLCDLAAAELRMLTGYDRVMIYRFDPDGAGTVVAEDRAAALESYLDLRYPASDIPPQARRLYRLQRVRGIPDIEYTPVPLLAHADGPPLDLSYCALRAVSPAHIEYLRNMGVRATLAVSLLQDGELWGMIVCHHNAPRNCPADTRALCDMIGQLISVLLLRVSEAEELSGRLARHHAVATLRDSMESVGGVAEGLAREARTVLGLMDAGGAMIRFGGVTRLIGQTPPEAAAAALVGALRERHGEAIASVEDAGRPGQIAAGCADTAAGVLLMPVANNPGDAIAWFRPEVVRTVRWGGDRRQPHVAAPDGRLLPRKSFAAWVEQVSGCSLPWTSVDLRTAHDLRRTITAALLRQAETQLAQLSAYDALTGLANRRTLDATLERWRAGTEQDQAVLMFVDLDRFKAINDTLGHAAGDQVLTEVAARLRHLAPAGSLVGRLGGDEFVLFWPGVGQEEAVRLADALLRELGRPFMLQDRPHHAGASIGVACAGRGPDGDLVREADAAMYAAKRAGGDQVVVYQPALHAAVLTNMQTEQDLFRAVDNGELEVHYQPIVRVADRGIHGFEALLRWRHPDRGWVSPAEFIPRAEEAGLIKRIGAWVMAEAIRQLALWHALDRGLTMSINVAPRQLTEGGISDTLSALLTTHRVAPGRVCVEVTESALMHEAAVRELQLMRTLGVRIAVDDFGVGYSSLSYLRTLPVTKVKIDRSFVTTLGSSRRADRFFRAIVDLAHTIDLRTVAEGVETEAQWQSVAAAGCELVQGWLIAKAMDPATATRDLRARIASRNDSSRASDGGAPSGPSREIVPRDKVADERERASLL